MLFVMYRGYKKYRVPKCKVHITKRTPWTSSNNYQNYILRAFEWDKVAQNMQSDCLAYFKESKFQMQLIHQVFDANCWESFYEVEFYKAS